MKLNTIQTSASNNPSSPQVAANRAAADAAPSFRETLADRHARAAGSEPHTGATGPAAHGKTADNRSAEAKDADKPAAKTHKAQDNDRRPGRRDSRSTDQRAQADTKLQPAPGSAAGIGQAGTRPTPSQPSQGDTAAGDQGKAKAQPTGGDSRAQPNAARATDRGQAQPDGHAKNDVARDRGLSQPGRPDNAAQGGRPGNIDGHGWPRQTDARNTRPPADDKDKSHDRPAADTPFAAGDSVTALHAQTRGNADNAPGADSPARSQQQRAQGGESAAGDGAKPSAAPDTAAADTRVNADTKDSARLFANAGAARAAAAVHDAAQTGAQIATPNHAASALTHAASPTATPPSPGAPVAVATPLTANLAPPVGTDAWRQALGQQALRVSHRGGGQAQLTLHPAHLGKLHVSVDMNQQAPQIHFASPHADVRAAVQSALPQLRDAFTQAGIYLGGTSVGEHARRESDTPSQRRDRDRGGATGAALGEREPAADTRITAIAGRTLSGGIDIFA